MKVAEVMGGVTTTVTIRSTSGEFLPRPKCEDEVRLVYSHGQTLLHHNEGPVRTVEGVAPEQRTTLTAVMTQGLPVLAFVAQPSAHELVLKVRQFTQELRIAEPLQLGLDEKALEDIQKNHKVGGTVQDVARWLEDRLLLPPAVGEASESQRLVVVGDPRGHKGAFRIVGHRIAADVRRIENRLQIERVVRGGQNNKERQILLSAAVSIVDATVAAELHGNARNALSEAVAANQSYLRIWQKYHNIEVESVKRRARSFGSLQFDRCEKQRDGSWRFFLVTIDDLPDRLALLGDWDRFELEASDRAPAFGESGAARGQPPKRGNAKVKRLSGAILDCDEQRRVMDIAGPDEDDEAPVVPSTGYLSLSTTGDEARLQRRARAEEALRTGNCPLPQLGLLMEGRPALAARRNRVSVDGPKLKPIIRDCFGSGKPTQRQLEAIENALNTPDICLIQGPPGTGKTKVITAIQRCLAELADEGMEASHRILVSAAQHDAVENVAQRTEVFGLPAVKVGHRRRGSDSDVDPTQAFVHDRIEALRAQLREPPEAERLARARRIAVVCLRSRSLPTEQAARLRDLARILDDLMPPTLRDEVTATAARLERPSSAGDPEEIQLLVRSARGIRVDPGTFADDGPIKARIALTRLNHVLSSEERDFLERCRNVEVGTSPAWITEGAPLRDNLVDRLTPRPAITVASLAEEAQHLVLKVLDTVDQRRAATLDGEDAALAAYLDDLSSDPEGVRQALEHYTVVLAATLQHAVGNRMRNVLGIREGQATFESVIIDEAARANPLDLFIPLSMAKRRVVLVGDHRQLPHLLEPDVERQLAEGVDQGTVEKQMLSAVQASLFERLWVLLRALEQKDGIRRTVTLNAQYRMHPVLGAYVSRQFYEVHNDGMIESPRLASEFTHDLPGYTKDGIPCVAAWLKVPQSRGKEVRGVSKSRPAEARAIAKEVRRLIDHDTRLTFGIIAFYSAQVDLIGRELVKEGLAEADRSRKGWRISDKWSTTYNHDGKMVERLRVGTVDAFQGKEFDVVFLSVTRSNDLSGNTDEEQRRKFGHLMLENRLCVAMSRQQRLLIAAGDHEFVRAADARKPLRALFAFAELCGGQHGIIR